MDEFTDRTAEALEYKQFKKESKTASAALAKNLLKQNQKQKELESKQIEIEKLDAAQALPGISLKKELQKELVEGNYQLIDTRRNAYIVPERKRHFLKIFNMRNEKLSVNSKIEFISFSQ